MKNKAIRITLYMVAIVIGFSFLTTGCSVPDNPIDRELQEILEEEAVVEEEEVENEEVIASFAAKVNDEEFSASKLIVGPTTGATVTFTNNGYLLNIYAIDLEPSLKRVRTIGLYITGLDFDEVIAGAIFNEPSNFIFLEPGAFCIYAEDIDTDDDDVRSTTTTNEISIEITAIDREKQRISGKFVFKGIDGETDIIYTITEGVFADIAYEVK